MVRSLLYWKEARPHKDAREKEFFERRDRRSNWDILMSITKYKDSIWAKTRVIIKGMRFVEYHQPIDVTNNHCTLKYVRAGQILAESDVITREMMNLPASENGGVFHAMFENQETTARVSELAIADLGKPIHGYKETLKK